MSSPPAPNLFLGAAFERYYRARPLTLVDVGARHGIQERWKAAQRHLRVIAFECDEAEHARLLSSIPRGANVLCLSTALHNMRGEADFYLARSPGLSSFLEPNWELLQHFPDAERFQTERIVRLKTDRLDAQLEVNGIVDVDFVKLDTQGTELVILEGAQRILSAEVLGLEVEVEFVPLYREQPLFADVDTMLRGHGFDLFDLRPTYWKRALGADSGGPQGQLMFGDALYLRRASAFGGLLDSPHLNAGDLRGSKLFRFLTICLLYGYADYALALANEAHRRDVLERQAFDQIRSVLQGWRVKGDRLPSFRGRGRLALAARSLYRVLRVRNGWSTGREALGNER
jgi:FkbM family methyltransferase